MERLMNAAIDVQAIFEEFAAMNPQSPESHIIKLTGHAVNYMGMQEVEGLRENETLVEGHVTGHADGTFSVEGIEGGYQTVEQAVKAVMDKAEHEQSNLSEPSADASDSIMELVKVMSDNYDELCECAVCEIRRAIMEADPSNMAEALRALDKFRN